MMFLRHLLSFLLLPFVVTVVVPLSMRTSLRLQQPHDSTTTAIFIAGCLALIIALLLFISSLYEFAARGKGTLAPWDPPKHLVVHGPYCYVRNPMISGVIFFLLAEAAMFRSISLLKWAGLFLLINLIYIPLLEEPGLEARFGDEYRLYCRNVRRFIPRLRPWRAA